MDEKLFYNSYRDNRGLADLMPTFDNQRELFECLFKNGDNFLLSQGISVLTLRLILAQDAFRKLQDYELDLIRKPGSYSVNFEVAGFGSSVYVLTPAQGFIGDVLKRESVRAHEYFYAFLSSSASILDRLAHEINHLYKLGIDIDRVDWRSLHNKYSVLEKSNLALKSYLEMSSKDKNPQIKLLLDYRDVTEHHGAVKIEEFSDREIVISNTYCIKVQSDPRDANSPADIALIKTCREFFFLITKICNDVYGYTISDIKTATISDVK